MSVAEFFDMGGYALYVWGSFGATALFMIVEPLLLRSRRKSVLKRVLRINRMKAEASETSEASERTVNTVNTEVGHEG